MLRGEKKMSDFPNISERPVSASVLMPAFETPERVLREAIESVLAQTFRDFEFLILDNGSAGTRVAEIAREYAARDPRIRFFRNEKNAGISAGRNFLIERSRGEFLVVMDHDDVAFPRRLEKQIGFLRAHPDVGVCGAQVLRFPKEKRLAFPLRDSEIQSEMFFGCPLRHPAVTLRRSALGDIRYEAEFSPAEDYALFARLVGKTKFANLPDVLLRYRDDGGNTSAARKRLMQANAERVRERLRRERSAQWESVRGLYARLYRFELFSCIPLLTVRRELTKIRFYLFGKIFFLTVRFDRLLLKEKGARG